MGKVTPQTVAEKESIWQNNEITVALWRNENAALRKHAYTILRARENAERAAAVASRAAELA